MSPPTRRHAHRVLAARSEAQRGGKRGNGQEEKRFSNAHSLAPGPSQRNATGVVRAGVCMQVCQYEVEWVIGLRKAQLSLSLAGLCCHSTLTTHTHTQISLACLLLPLSIWPPIPSCFAPSFSTISESFAFFFPPFPATFRPHQRYISLKRQTAARERKPYKSRPPLHQVSRNEKEEEEERIKPPRIRINLSAFYFFFSQASPHFARICKTHAVSEYYCSMEHYPSIPFAAFSLAAILCCSSSSSTPHPSTPPAATPGS
jgi:hypothetical protein